MPNVKMCIFKCNLLVLFKYFGIYALLHDSSEIIKRAVSGLSLTVQMVEVDIGFRT